MLHKIAIITVVYRNYSILGDFFDSFKRQTKKNFKIYICDQTEKRHTFKIPKFAKVFFSENKGYGHGVNIGLKAAIQDGFDLFCIINSDTVVHENFIDTLINQMIKAPTSIIGGKIYYYPGFEYHKGRYSKDQLGGVIWYAGGKIDWNNVIGLHRGVDEVDEKKYTKFEHTDFVSGCLMAFDKSALDKIGFFDESYFLYYEDVDYCERAKRVGVSLYYDPSIIIWHKNAQSTEGSGSRLQQDFQSNSQLKFGLKYAPFRTKLHLIKNLILHRFTLDKKS